VVAQPRPGVGGSMGRSFACPHNTTLSPVLGSCQAFGAGQHVERWRFFGPAVRGCRRMMCVARRQCMAAIAGIALYVRTINCKHACERTEAPARRARHDVQRTRVFPTVAYYAAGRRRPSPPRLPRSPQTPIKQAPPAVDFTKQNSLTASVYRKTNLLREWFRTSCTNLQKAYYCDHHGRHDAQAPDAPRRHVVCPGRR